mgnify:CR=1 FL=1
MRTESGALVRVIRGIGTVSDWSGRVAAWLVLPLIALVLSTADSDADTVHARFPHDLPSPESVFTRMFPELPPFAPQTDAVRNVVKLLGARGGLLDALDNLSDPVQSVINPAFSPNNPNNAAMTAGITFLGQFLDQGLIRMDGRTRAIVNLQGVRKLIG